MIFIYFIKYILKKKNNEIKNCVYKELFLESMKICIMSYKRKAMTLAELMLIRYSAIQPSQSRNDSHSILKMIVNQIIITRLVTLLVKPSFAVIKEK